MKIKMRSDLAQQGESIPVINKEDKYLTAKEVSELEFIYSCDVTGDTAVKTKEGELFVLYSIDLDFIEKSKSYLTKEETKELKLLYKATGRKPNKYLMKMLGDMVKDGATIQELAKACGVTWSSLHARLVRWGEIETEYSHPTNPNQFRKRGQSNESI